MRIWHLLVVHGFLVLLGVTCYLGAAHYLRPALFEGWPYLFVSLAADTAGVALLLGVLIGVARPGVRHSGARGRRRLRRTGALLLLGLVGATGFLLEGLRIHLQGDPWAHWSPVGMGVARLLPPVPADRVEWVFRAAWWLHAILALCLIGSIPLARALRHQVFLPLHRARAPASPLGLPVPLDLASLRGSPPSTHPDLLGLASADDLTRTQRGAFLACMECGRCDTLCPAFQSGQPLSPCRLMGDLGSWLGDRDRTASGSGSAADAEPVDAVGVDPLWACRLCRACEERCPASVEHTDLVREIRWAEVLNHGRVPEGGGTVLRDLARCGNPYGGAREEQTTWLRETGLGERAVGPDAMLLWTGCFPPGDERKPRVLSSLLTVLDRLEVPVRVLGGAGACCGDPARLLGDEDLFQRIAAERIEEIQASGARELLVHCPHCYTVLGQVYPRLGARFRVTHTTSLVQRRLGELGLQVPADPATSSLAYHDPCFLARYHGITEGPREILRSLPGIDLLELPRSGTEALCCGGGGGHFFLDLDVQGRPSSLRMEEVLASGAAMLGVACGFCLAMLEDAQRRQTADSPLRIVDWVELLAERLEPRETSRTP